MSRLITHENTCNTTKDRKSEAKQEGFSHYNINNTNEKKNHWHTYKRNSGFMIGIPRGSTHKTEAQAIIKTANQENQ